MHNDTYRPWWTLFYDVHGNVSSKRVCGLAGFLTGLGMALLAYEVTLVLTVLSTSGGVLWGGVFEKKQAGSQLGDMLTVRPAADPDPDDAHLPTLPPNTNG